ncbi:MAG TPA: hypothetical protein VK154_16730 [Chitinophagales bacterium]|nr:hypothetical protein [Chitinophagales bacterium]
MRVIIFVCTLFAVAIAYGQTGELTYHLVKKDSTAFNCKILVEKPKGYLVQLENDSIQLVLRSQVAGLYIVETAGKVVSVDSISKRDIKNLEQKEVAKEKHKTWDTCFVVTQDGDTLYGKVEGSIDYSLGGGSRYELKEAVPMGGFLADAIKFVFAGDSEQVFNTAEIKELYLYRRSEEFRRYISIKEDNGNENLYRIIVEGKCRLLYRLIAEHPAAAMQQPFLGNTAADPLGGGYFPVFSRGPGSMNTAAQFYIYYKNKLTTIRSDSRGNLFAALSNLSFNEKSRELFAECPALVEEIEEETARTANLREIVKQFNLCLAKRVE